MVMGVDDGQIGPEDGLVMIFFRVEPTDFYTTCSRLYEAAWG